MTIEFDDITSGKRISGVVAGSDVAAVSASLATPVAVLAGWGSNTELVAVRPRGPSSDLFGRNGRTRSRRLCDRGPTQL
jgi:hypothetical protein